MLLKSTKTSKQFTGKLSRDLAEYPLSVLIAFHQVAAKTKLVDSARDLVNQAIELVNIFNCSISIYHLHMAGSWAFDGFRVDERFMEGLGQYHSTTHVASTISFCLSNIGNAFEEGYDQSSILLEAEVLT